ncbi:platelet-activating factor acetylhydrolase-like [Ctenocephalides felis]|uniref:platelet-activating factor acetylhydrolase-like n=1 Tax=Ctenocephalides felis TaxID=7515 RepID=UPI000E6E16A3|nr:platelet-activating factor acetylhydrolase-like [Ctenocephalides felis]
MDFLIYIAVIGFKYWCNDMWFTRSTYLPAGDGPYLPGCIDVMTDYSRDGCFFRLYYPSAINKQEALQNPKTKWMAWCPDIQYIDGFARVILLWSYIFKLWIWLKSGLTYVRTLYGVPISKSCGEKLKVLVFSHGLGGSRFFYSTVCNDMASRGYIVAAVEHRDRSACATYHYEDPKARATGQRTWLPYRYVSFGSGHYDIRNQQVKQRAQEVQQCIDMLQKINNGENVINIMEREKDNMKLLDFKGILDMSQLAVMGQSFGAATSLLVLANDKRVKSGVILDAWMFPLKDMKALPERVTQPMIFINTQTFHIASNLAVMEKFTQNSKEAERIVYTIKHTTHENQIDTPFIVGYWLKWFMTKLKPIEALRINNCLILRFLDKHVGVPADITDVNKHLAEQIDNYEEGDTKPWHSVGAIL